jgi:TetR/AcrR family transcriptional regulator, mexJK operon transcriptional repressor
VLESVQPAVRRDRRAGRGLSPRTVAKREAITDAAVDIFLSNGYRGTTMDDIAAAAGVSKVTLYKQFGDKETLFSTIVLGVTAQANAIATEIEHAFNDIRTARDVEPLLTALAERYARGVIAPRVVRLRRLVIAEANRFPDLASAYYEGAPQRALTSLAKGFARLNQRGLLRIPEPDTAASQFAYLVLGPLIDRALFQPRKRITRTDLATHVTAAVSAFLKATRRDR